MPKVLTIDDELGILAVVEKFLRKKGFEVITADNGEKGLKAFDRDKSIDIIILDHKMPRLNGAAVLNVPPNGRGLSFGDGQGMAHEE